MLRSEKNLFVIHAIGLIFLVVIMLFYASMPAWPSLYTPLLLVSVVMMAFALALRLLDTLPRVALTLIALCHFAFLVILITDVNVALMPTGSIINDQWLMQLDAAIFGYVWERYVAFFTDYPNLIAALRIVYVSVFSMFLVTVLSLGLSGEARKLQHMVWTAAIAGMLTLIIWSALSTFGPTAIIATPRPVVAQADILVNVDYGRVLRSFAARGIDGNANATLGGLIAFPSFHMVMALIAAWFSWRHWAGYVVIPLAAIMAPATLLHGGHHLLDIFGGLVVFIVALVVARAIVFNSFLADPVRFKFAETK